MYTQAIVFSGIGGADLQISPNLTMDRALTCFSSFVSLRLSLAAARRRATMPLGVHTGIPYFHTAMPYNIRATCTLMNSAGTHI